MENYKLLKNYYGLRIMMTPSGGLAVCNSWKPLQFFNGVRAVMQATDYILSLDRTGELARVKKVKVGR